MRIAVIGGTRFIGRALVDELLGHGHDVLVVHRGEHEPPGLPDTPHLHANRGDLASHRAALHRFAADALVDLAAATGEDSEVVLGAVEVERLLVVSSMDVYRAFASLMAGASTDAVPLTEEAALREGPPPDRDGPPPPGWDFDADRYDKLDVERAYLAGGATVCRLPFVYGEHDYNRREEFVLRRLRARRPRIPIGSGGWLGSRGYAPELARGMRLALEADTPGEVFNLCEASCAPMRLWAGQIVTAAGVTAELVRVADEDLPADLALTGSLSQPMLADSGKAERRLGWVHAPAPALVERSVAWHLEHPPPTADEGFAQDDRALEAAAGR